MNVEETAAFHDYCIAAGVWARPQSDDMRLDQIAAWSQILEDVPTSFGLQRVNQWEPNAVQRYFQPTSVAFAWRMRREAEVRESVTYDEAACAWARLCTCPHVDCYHGQMREAGDKTTIIETRSGVTNRYTTGVRWCPRCWDARNLKRVEEGKDARDYADVRP